MSALAENFGNFISSMLGDKKPKTTTPTVHQVPWGVASFPVDGSGRTVEMVAGEILHFRALDQLPHNVAEADVLKKNRWLPARERKLNINFKTSQNFNQRLTISVEGTYYLVCPIDDHHKVMRLKVVVTPDRKLDKIKSEFEHYYHSAIAAVKHYQEKKDRETHCAAEKAVEHLHRFFTQNINYFSPIDRAAITNNINQFRRALGNNTNPGFPSFRPVHIGSAEILAGTGILETKPTFSFAQLNFFDPRVVIGPLGPIVRQTNSRRPDRPVQPFRPVRVEVEDDDDDEIIVKAEAKPRNKRQNDEQKKDAELDCSETSSDECFSDDDSCSEEDDDSCSDLSEYSNM
jgi:plastocyanin